MKTLAVLPKLQVYTWYYKGVMKNLKDKSGIGIIVDNSRD